MTMNLLRAVRALLFIVSLSSTAQQVTIVNASTQDLEVSLSPVDGYWGARMLTGSDRDHALIWGGGWKQFLISKNQSATIACQECARFHFLSDVAISGLDNLAAGRTYRIEGGAPLFRISDSAGSVVLTGIKTEQFSPWEEFWLHWASNSAVQAKLHVVLSKAGGAWPVGTSELLAPTTTLDLSPGFNRIPCGHCRPLRVISVQGQTLSTKIEAGVVYEIDDTGGSWIVSKSILSPPQIPRAPGSATGTAYIVNGQPTNLSFNFHEGANPITLVTLLGREGARFDCHSGCEVEVRTGNSAIRRSLQAGKSYMIVFDPLADSYDLRVYSQ